MKKLFSSLFFLLLAAFGLGSAASATDSPPNSPQQLRKQETPALPSAFAVRRPSAGVRSHRRYNRGFLADGPNLQRKMLPRSRWPR
jgi:hypothetical protein